MAGASTPSTPPATVAAAILAGVNPQTARKASARSQLLAQVLQSMQASGQQIRSGGELGSRLLAEYLAYRGKVSNDQTLSDIQKQIAAARYPNDPKAQLLYLTAPDDMDKAAASAYQTQDIRQGNTLGTAAGGASYTAPIMGNDGGYFYNQTPQGVSILGRRPQSYQEQTAAAGQTEAARHNQASEGIDLQKIPIELGMLQTAIRNSNTSAGGLNLQQTNSPNFAPPPGYLLDPAPGGR